MIHAANTRVPESATLAISLAQLRRAIIKSAMKTQNLMLSEFPSDDQYRVSDLDDVLTPALVVYPEMIERNIARTLHLLDGQAERWRPHIKTAKLGYTLR